MIFRDLKIIPPLDKALVKLGINEPTEIQYKAIPQIIKHKDILGSAQTGSGKTLAFTIPVLHNMYNKRLKNGLVEGKIKRRIKTLILAPTRELAIQIGETFAPFCTNTNFKHTTIYGGKNQFHQVKALEKGVEILIATPGRLLDLNSQGFINLSYVENFIIDEADKMLEMGFMVDIKKIIKKIPTERQTLFFSATMPKEVRELASTILTNPINITVNTVFAKKNTIKQKVYHINQGSKRQLLQQINKRKDLESIIVFSNTKDTTENVFEYTQKAGIPCDTIHRNKTQNQRQRALKALKDGEIKVLVATDIASRGLDVSNLSCVINYDVPGDPETYIHRIGRTGRAGKEGLAITFVTDQDKKKLKDIESLIGESIEVVKDTSYKKEVIAKTRYKMTTNEYKKDKAKKKRLYSRTGKRG